jgi:hypothetical protein
VVRRGGWRRASYLFVTIAAVWIGQSTGVDEVGPSLEFVASIRGRSYWFFC